MDDITLSFKHRILQGEAPLPSSKSISNRYLILQFLAEEDFDIENLSDSDDTRLMQKLLKVIRNHD